MTMLKRENISTLNGKQQSATEKEAMAARLSVEGQYGRALMILQPLTRTLFPSGLKEIGVLLRRVLHTRIVLTFGGTAINAVMSIRLLFMPEPTVGYALFA